MEGMDFRMEGENEEALRAARKPAQELLLSVIVPVRDEERALRACLRSLVSQSEPGWQLGEHWELLVVDDGSSDGTAAVARECAGVQLLNARQPLPRSWTGKANSCWTGAETARGQWLLFTNARAMHQPGSLSRSLIEADRYKAGMVSYDAAPAVAGLAERALLPLILSELRSAYPYPQVNNPDRRISYASGEFLLVRAEAYRALGGDATVAASLVPEVDLAFALKRQKFGLRVRYAPEMVSVDAESSLAALWARWKRKLALLIHNIAPLALWRLLDVALVWGLLLLALLYPVPFPWERGVLFLLWLRTLWRVYRRTARSQMAAADIAIAIVLGLPLFAALLYAGWYQTRMLKRIDWKGREYQVPKRR